MANGKMAKVNATRFDIRGSSQVAASTKSNTLAAIGGVADCLTILGYILDKDIVIFGGIGLAIKLIIIFFLPIRDRSWIGESLPITFMILSLLSLFISPYHSVTAFFQIIAISLGMILSVLIVADEERLYAYGKAFTNTVCASSLFYMLLILSGSIESGGRATYFSGYHSNLGSEIHAIAAISACIFFRGKGLAIRVIITLIPAILMQGRGAILAIIIASLFAFTFDSIKVSSKNRSSILILFSILFAMFIVLSTGILDGIIKSIFLIDNPYRGEGSGFSGRTDRWLFAYGLFLESPLFGNSQAIYESREIPTPHSFFMYGLVNLGLTFLIILAMMIFHGARAWKRDRRAALILSAVFLISILIPS